MHSFTVRHKLDAFCTSTLSPLFVWVWPVADLVWDGADNSDATHLVGRNGMALFGKKSPKWYPCVVKKDNMDGTIKVQWDEDKKYTKRLPVENFRLEGGDTEDPMDVPCIDIFGPKG